MGVVRICGQRAFNLMCCTSFCFQKTIYAPPHYTHNRTAYFSKFIRRIHQMRQTHTLNLFCTTYKSYSVL